MDDLLVILLAPHSLPFSIIDTIAAWDLFAPRIRELQSIARREIP